MPALGWWGTCRVTAGRLYARFRVVGCMQLQGKELQGKELQGRVVTKVDSGSACALSAGNPPSKYCKANDDLSEPPQRADSENLGSGSLPGPGGSISVGLGGRGRRLPPCLGCIDPLPGDQSL